MNYQIVQGTKAQGPGGRFVIVIPAGYPWGNIYTVLSNFYTSGIVFNQAYSHTFHPSYNSPWSNVMPVVGLLLKNATLSNLPQNTTVYVSTWDGLCTGTYYQHNGTRICLLDTAYDTSTNHKFIIAHEFGHFGAWHQGGPMNGAYFSDGPEADCSCSHLQGSDMYRWHCLQSKEYIGTAAVEGYAHFISSMTFNYQSASNCSFTYYKNQRENGVITVAPFAVSCIQNVRWMDTHCDPGNANLGTERDWLVFLWNLWTYGDSASHFSSAEVGNIYSNTSPYGELGERWNDLTSTVVDIYGSLSYKHLQWVYRGYYAGVDHYQ
jgi:hypothetical protein